MVAFPRMVFSHGVIIGNPIESVNMSLYTDLLNAGVPISNHESDLYFEINDISDDILTRHPEARPKRFLNQVTNTMWYEVYFVYDPWWANKMR